MRIRVHVRQCGGQVARTHENLSVCARDTALPFIEICNEFKHDRRYRHRKHHAEEAGKRITGNERHDNEQGRDADNLLHDERIDEVGFKLIYHDIETGNHGRDCNAAIGISNDNRHHPPITRSRR